MNGIDTVQLAVLSDKFESIVHEMENTLLRTGRSAILNMARDFSCGIMTSDHRLLSSGVGLPVHVIGMQELGRTMCDLHPDLSDGDAYLHNDPYMGNTQAADHTILVPVFVGDTHYFTVAAKAHQADIGNSEPSTYMPFAKDVYEEGGLIFPAVQVQRGRQDVEDIIRMCQRRIRAPEQWYGDYLAMVGAARIGETRLQEVITEYGPEAIEEFVDSWLEYSERIMVSTIEHLEPGQAQGTSVHDPIPPALPDGVEVNVRVIVDPDSGFITVDLRDNQDAVSLGINESKACAVANATTGILNSISPDVPKNSGSLRRIKVLLRDDCIVGNPSFPTSTSVATTNLGERIVVATQKCVAERWPGQGRAEGACGAPGPGFAVISGYDFRSGSAEFYVNQIFVGSQGGPAGPAYDGWVTYGNSVTDGLMLRDSIEVDEQKYPIRVKEIRLRPNSEGSGRRRGAPGFTCAYGPTEDSMDALYVSDSVINPPQGAQGGGAALAARVSRITNTGGREVVDLVGGVHLRPGEFLEHQMSGGGGYGPPLDREFDRVRDDVLAGFITIDRARDVYGVVFAGGTTGADLSVDIRASESRRLQLRSQRHPMIPHGREVTDDSSESRQA